MLLINRKTSANTPLEATDAGVASEERKSVVNLPKLSISGLFKKSKGGKLSRNPTSESLSGISPKASKESAARIPISIMDDAYITIVSSNEDQANYTHHQEAGYHSFTSECISLQNSEMTYESAKPRAHIPGAPLLAVPTSLNAMLVPDRDGAPPASDLRKILTATSQSDLTSDIVSLTSLCDSASDLDFDPKNEESEREYKHGGYHPVTKGEVYYSAKYAKEYVILRKLGWGHFSTVWLAKSRTSSRSASCSSSCKASGSNGSAKSWKSCSEQYVAIKFVKSNKNYLEAAEDEIRILQALQDPLHADNRLSTAQRAYFGGDPTRHPGFNSVMKLLDDFEVTGPNGQHICMVFEVLGENVLSLIYKFKQLRTAVNSTANSTDGSAERTTDSGASSGTTETSVSPAMKFYKWDSKAFKKNTKSMLSLGMGRTLPKVKLSINTNVQLDSTASSGPAPALSNIIQSSRTKGGIPLGVVRQVVRQMLTAMDYVHHCGVIHTDLKPENILVEIDNVDGVIRDIEREKRARRSTVTSFSPPKDEPSPGFARASTFPSSVCSYRRSKNSSLESPIRCSKPLPGSSCGEFFSGFAWQHPSKSAVHKSESVSPCGFAVAPSASVAGSSHSAPIAVKIADLGNATFSHTHFTNQIQTRQYRAPEIILKYKSWGASTDMWSLGCIIFELITGDFLFDPYDGKLFDKEEDHLAQIIELLGEFPSDEYLIDCKLTSKHFKLDASNKVVLKNIDGLKFWGLQEVLIEKYKFTRGDPQVRMISDLILKCLRFGPGDRFDCKSLLKHPWLRAGIEQELAEGPEAIFEEMEGMVNDHEDIPGYTGTWGEEEEYFA